MIEFILTRPKLIHAFLGVYWLLLLAATSIPSNNMPSISMSDKLQHFSAYAVLSILLFLSLSAQKKFPLNRVKAIQATIFLCLIYAALDELHQMLIPGRFCEFYDWVANAFGALAGTFTGNLLSRMKKNS